MPHFLAMSSLLVLSFCAFAAPGIFRLTRRSRSPMDIRQARVGKLKAWGLDQSKLPLPERLLRVIAWVGMATCAGALAWAVLRGTLGK